MSSQGKNILQLYSFIKSRNFLVVVSLLLFSLQLYSQSIKRTNNWYFGISAGVSFNSGEPVPLHDGELSSSGYRGVITMSDTNGSLLYYTNGWKLWNKNHTPIDNTFVPSWVQMVSFLVVGSDHMYYIFGVPFYSPPTNYYKTSYAVIDMTMNGGLGGVSGDIIPLDAAWDAAEKITAAKHKNKQDIWVITRKYTENKYASFLINENGVNSNPVYSPAPELALPVSDMYGQIKISYDKEYLINCHSGGWSVNDKDWVEVCKFNDKNGEVDYLYSFKFTDIINPLADIYPYGVEFSPDSKFLYISFHKEIDTSLIYQFEVQYIEDSTAFIQSGVKIGDGGNQTSDLQLASDGKIYVTTWSEVPYLGVIHKPWVKGVDCQFDSLAVFLEPGTPEAELPSFLLDDLYRFEFEGICEGESYDFTPFFHPEPINIIWDFGDPASGNNTSTELNPVHTFSDGGVFEVSVHVEYPSGRIEETSRKVKVEYAPEPYLGPDTTICNGEEVLLDAACGPHTYSWSTGHFGVSQITVSDTGWYWVRVVSEQGCIAFDSVYVGYRHPSIADTTNLVISPTTCGGSNGIIRGLGIIGDPPFILQWLDDSGTPIATTLDIYNLPVGGYTLQVTDNNNCITNLGPYFITDAGDILIEDVDFMSEHCNQQNGIITVNATSGLSDVLFYSIDNGATYYSNQGVFTGLSPGSYAVRVKDSLNCQDVFVNNPIIIENLPGPLVSNVVVTPSIAGQNTGAIEIIALGSSDTLFYSNNSGTSFQENDGMFSSLIAGNYTCVVLDEYGCDTTFIIEVPDEITIRLQALAGDDEVCPGNSAFVPLIVSYFSEVASFKTTLFYNKDLLICEGFANAHPLLEDSLKVSLFTTQGKVELEWSSSSISLNDSTKLADLVFQSVDPGLCFVEWDGNSGASFFQNTEGVNIPADFFIGNVKIYNNVSFEMRGTTHGCRGDTLLLMPMVWISNGLVDYLWTDPMGDTNTGNLLTIDNIQPSQAGMYTLIITDTLGCYSDTTFEIVLYPSPEIPFAPYDTLWIEPGYELDAGKGASSYQWNTGETSGSIIIDTMGYYQVEVTSTDDCKSIDAVQILWGGHPFYLPNAFSPNGDGLNDKYGAIPKYDHVRQYHLSIYNRWGQMMFETNAINGGWDGTFQGEPCPGGVYVYRIVYEEFGQQPMENKVVEGTVMLVR